MGECDAERPGRREDPGAGGGASSDGTAVLGSKTGLALGLLAVAALSLLLRAAVAEVPLERDEGEYAYTAWRWLAGDVPYRDSFLQKPPGVLAAYALFLALGSGATAIHWGAQLWTLGTLTCVVWLGAIWFSVPAGLAAGLLMALLSVDPAFLGNAANTELLSLLPLALAMVAARRAGVSSSPRAAFAAGAAGAAGLAFKPVAAPIVAVALAGIAVTTTRRARAVLAFALGGIAVAAPVAGYFVSVGAWDALWDATVRYNLAYGTSKNVASYLSPLRVQADHLLGTVGPVFGAALLGVALPLLRARTERAGVRPGWAWCVAWLAAALLAAAAGGYFRPHYFMYAAPPLALLAGAGLDAAARRLGGPARAAWLAPAAATTLVAYAVWAAPWYYLPGPPGAKSRRIYGNNPFAESPGIGAWLAAHSDPDERIFLYGSEPQVFFYARRRSASRYIFVYPLTAPYEGVRARQQEALREIRERPPKFVVATFLSTSLGDGPGTPPELREGLRALVDESYRLVAATPFRADGSVAFVTGEPVRRLWERRPLWEEPRPWASFVIWERDASGPPPSAARGP